MTEDLTVAVVTPSFNQGVFVESTLRSVLDQAYQGLEYVVVDGGSTDGSADAIRRYAKDLAYWVSEPDHGHADALNKGFAHTTGDVMCWINSSDLHFPWTLQTVAEIFSQLPEVEWITGISTEFGASGGPRRVTHGFFNVYDILGGNFRWIQQESVFWRRSLWERAGGALDNSLVCAADFDLWLRFFRLAPLYHVDTILGGFRQHENPLRAVGDGLHEREVQARYSAFAAGFDARDRRRARMVRAVGTGRYQVVARGLHKLGIWPWYRHPRVTFDFTRERWVSL